MSTATPSAWSRPSTRPRSARSATTGREAVAAPVARARGRPRRLPRRRALPLESEILGRRVLVTPAPSRGGEIVLEILASLEALDSWSLHGEARAVALAYERSWPGALSGTTHISVVDAEGRAAALSSTLGSGSGVFRGGAQLNNMLGRARRHRRGAAGARRAAPEHDDPDARARGRPARGSSSAAPAPCGWRARSPRSRGGSSRARTSPGDRGSAAARRRDDAASRGWLASATTCATLPPRRGTSSAGTGSTSSSAACRRSRGRRADAGGRRRPAPRRRGRGRP